MNRLVVMVSCPSSLPPALPCWVIVPRLCLSVCALSMAWGAHAFDAQPPHWPRCVWRSVAHRIIHQSSCPLLLPLPQSQQQHHHTAAPLTPSPLYITAQGGRQGGQVLAFHRAEGQRRCSLLSPPSSFSLHHQRGRSKRSETTPPPPSSHHTHAVTATAAAAAAVVVATRVAAAAAVAAVAAAAAAEGKHGVS